jgi:hypothetical protein
MMSLRTGLFGALAGVLFSAGLVATGWHFGASSERADALKTLNENQLTWEAKRNELQDIITVSSAAYAERQAQSEGTANRTLADLRSGNIKLRVKLADATIASLQSCSGAIVNGRAELHPSTAQALVRITQDADSQVQALQEIVRGLTK